MKTKVVQHDSRIIFKFVKFVKVFRFPPPVWLSEIFFWKLKNLLKMTLDVRSGSKLVRLFQTTSFVYHDALTSVNMVPDWPIWYCHINVLHVCPPPINGKTLKPVRHQNRVYHSWKLNYSPKRSMTSYRQCSLFLRFRSIWGFCKWFQMIPYTQKCGLKKTSLYLAWKSSYSMKFYLTSYSPYRLFLTFRSIWGLWKWSRMISHSKKTGD